MLALLPSCFESILWVTVESVLGSQVYLEWIGTLGSFEFVAQPLEFLTSVKWRPPPLEMHREHRDSFLDESGKRTLLSR